MAGGITLEIAQAQLTSALGALELARTQQRSQFTSATGGRLVDRANHSELLADVRYWEQKVASLSRPRGGLRTWSAVPR
jgi:hypothetical protein